MSNPREAVGEAFSLCARELGFLDSEDVVVAWVVIAATMTPLVDGNHLEQVVWMDAPGQMLVTTEGLLLHGRDEIRRGWERAAEGGS